MLDRIGITVGQVWRASGPGGKVLLALGAALIPIFCASLFVATPPPRPGQPTIRAGVSFSTAKPTDVVFTPTPVPPTNTPLPTNTVPPTNTPGPTNTPTATRTPQPTNTPRPTPEPTKPPEPIILSGSGQSVTDPIDLPEGIFTVRLVHEGSRNFIIKVYRGDIEDLLVNAIGRYAGTRAVRGGGKVFFEVTASSSWSIQIEPLGIDQSGSGNVAGQGDSIIGRFDPVASGATPYLFTHDGQRNFVIQLICAGGQDLVQNEIGSVDNAAVVRFPEGPCLWDIQADGAWTLKPK